MKALLFLLLSFCVFSCKSNDEMLTGKNWLLFRTMGLEDSKFLKHHRKVKTDVLNFNRNGMVSVAQEGKETALVAWEWQDKETIRMFWRGVNTVFKVKKLEDEELVLSKTDNETFKVLTMTFLPTNSEKWVNDNVVDALNKNDSK